jgi:AbrB family looped-hinge helix DNA binding protein
MARVKIEDSRITLPSEVRRALHVGENDFVEFEVVEQGVLLKPSDKDRREEAWRRIEEAQRSVRYIGPEPEPSQAEIDQMIVEEVKAARRERAKGRS